MYVQVSAVKKTAKNATPNVPPFSSVALYLMGTHSEQENAVNGQYLYMHVCIAVGSNVRQSVHPSLLSMQSKWICLHFSAQAMSPLTTGDLMDQDLETKN